MLKRLKSSLQLKLIIAVTAVPFFIHGIFSIVRVYDDRNVAIYQMQLNQDRVLNELAHGLSVPLWNLDLEQTKILLNLKLRERDLSGVIIQDLNGNTQVFGLFKQGEQIVETFTPKLTNVILRSIDIEKDGSLYWRADCYFTDRYIKQSINRQIVYSLFMNLALIAIIIVLLIITLNLLVIRPIRKTTAVFRKISEGDFSERVLVQQTDEIGEIGIEINHLLDQLEETINEVTTVMKAMSQGDFSTRMTGKVAGDLQKLKSHTNQSIKVLSERTQQLNEAQQELIDKAHKAGMADVASGTLHNVGNILNSVKVSAQVIRSELNHSNVQSFVRANDLLRENMNTLEDFVVNNPKGKMLMEYYLKLETILLSEQQLIESNLNRLIDKIDMIADVIVAQQSYAGISSLIEVCSLDVIIDDALKLQSGSIERYGIEVIKKIAARPLVPIQKAKLVHILINLIKNAKEAMLDSPTETRKLTISLSDNHENKVFLKVQDTGKGIDADNMKKIFTHGFTTKRDGHGFGLHSCANYMEEMNGRIWAESDGENRGACFILEFNLPAEV